MHIVHACLFMYVGDMYTYLHNYIEVQLHVYMLLHTLYMYIIIYMHCDVVCRVNSSTCI